MSTENRLDLLDTGLVVTQFKITGTAQAHTINFSFDTLPGNIPGSYSNTIYIWQNQNQIPWNSPYLKSFCVSNNSQAGSGSFSDLDITVNSYILGYAVGSGPQYICSTAYIPKSGGGENQYFQTVLSIVDIGSTSLDIRYTTPAGDTPHTNGHWIGIWEGSVASYNNPPKWKNPVSGETSSGNVSFNNILLTRGTTYTIAYFTGNYDKVAPTNLTAMACTLTFAV